MVFMAGWMKAELCVRINKISTAQPLFAYPTVLFHYFSFTQRYQRNPEMPPVNLHQSLLPLPKTTIRGSPTHILFLYPTFYLYFLACCLSSFSMGVCRSLLRLTQMSTKTGPHVIMRAPPIILTNQVSNVLHSHNSNIISSPLRSNP